MSFGDLRASQNYMWDCTKALGQGATSKVYKGRCKNSGEEVAVKVFTTAGNMRPFEVQLREFNVIKKLKHENIVQLIAIEETSSGDKVIVMELSRCGSLYTVLDEPENSFGLEEEEFKLVVKHVAGGMRYLNQNGIVHRDIKPGNILRYKGEDGRSVYKLTDFGAARQLEYEDEQFTSLYGTEEYLHPNIYGRAVLKSPDIGPFDATVDLWSLGVTFYHAATGQLPFRPFGGRKNKHTMYDITTKKESGVISGVQKVENGKIEWSRELPPTCMLSDGLKKLFTQILAKLLESDAKKKWNFEAFFAEIENIFSLEVVHVFCSITWCNIKIYIDKDSKLSKLKELIAEQCEIAAVNQLLIFERELFEVRVDALTPVCNYPKANGPENPIFVYLKMHPERKGFPSAIYPEYPRFGGTNNIGNDYQLAKTCCAVMCFQYKIIQSYHLREEMIRQSVHNYIHELHHEITHLVDYLKHQRQHSDTCKMWFSMFKSSVLQNLHMLNITDGVKQHTEQLSQKLNQEQDYLSSGEKQMLNTLMKASDQLKALEVQELNRKKLERMWKDELGCYVDIHRCAEKIEVMVETVKKIVHHFKEHRQSRILDHNTGSIHTFEKNKLQELCSKSQSIMENCYKNSERQYNYYYRWFRTRHRKSKLTGLSDETLNQVSGKKDQPRPVIVKFKDTDSKLKVLRKRKDLRNSYKVVEDVTKHNMSLITKLINNEQIEQAYYFNTRVYGKTKDGHRMTFEIFDDIDYKIAQKNQAIDTRFLCDNINMHLAQLEMDQNQFAHRLEQSSKKMNQSMHEILEKIPSVVKVQPMQALFSTNTTCNLLEQIANGMQTICNECEELSTQLNTNNELINRSCREIKGTSFEDKDS